jgi:hypothetical protein
MEKKNIIIIVLLLALTGAGFKIFGTTGSISPAEAQTKVQELIDMNPGNPAVITSTVKEGNLYKVTVSVEGQEFFSYISLDGKNFFPEAIDLEGIKQTQENQPKPEVSAKSDKPVVELFVMSHCPYGTQIEKGILPVLDVLGDKIDFELKFVDYAIHDKIELNEQTQQYCIREQGKTKLLNYLKCFLEDGDSERCVAQTEINTSELQKCITDTNIEYKTLVNYEDKSTWTKMSPASPIFTIHKEDNLKYGVEGSPELIINEEKISAYRDSSSLLSTICSAFNNPPSECETELSSATPAPGFGSGTTANSTDATCN